ncbi:MAG TPA: hypothetical protein VGM51_08260 [Armatimonadota bacterium]|jgi:hypothetical protein
MNVSVTRLSGAILVALMAWPSGALGEGLPASSSGVAVDLEAATGRYTVTSNKPDFTFSGKLSAAPSNVTTKSGRDSAGRYDEISFQWMQDGRIDGSIRRYRDRPIALFTWRTGEANQASPIAFPSFTEIPQGLNVLSYRDVNFSPFAFAPEKGSTPWVLFDGNGNTAVVSPAANFMTASMTGDAKSEITCAIDARVANLPKGFTHKTMLAFGQGINATWEAWGKGLTDFVGVKRPAYDADFYLKHLGYWTDNGAAYYYNYDKALGYEGTLLAVRDEMQRLGIPIRYVQLDSWWYQKTTVNYKGEDEKKPKVASLPEGTWNAYGGLTKYEAHPFVFPDGLDGFHSKVGMPLATHNRWIDVKSPYREKYDIPGLQSTDPKYWEEIIGYIARSGVKMYEQDWLNYTWDYSPRFHTEPYTAAAFLTAMAKACANHGLTMQYCMAQPRFFLQGATYPNLTNIRVSDDRFDRGKWERFLYTSRFASALGEWPWVDTYMSKERDNMLLATLSAGLVGFGDFMGQESVENALMAARPDGVLVKPDASIVPVDASVLSDARKEHKPMVASTYTRHGDRKTVYVFAFRRKGDTENTEFLPSDVGMNTAGYRWYPFDGGVSPVEADTTIRGKLATDDCTFLVLAPTGVSGIAFLGDLGKFVGTGKQRIESISEVPGSLTATVLFAEGEKSVTLHGYSPIGLQSSAGPVSWDAKGGHFTLDVASNGKPRVTLTISEKR